MLPDKQTGGLTPYYNKIHTACRMNAEAVPAIAIPATGAAELMAKAIADAQDVIRTSVSMKKKNLPASDSRPTCSKHVTTDTLLYIIADKITIILSL